MKRFLTEDWVVTFLSIPLLIIALFASDLNGGPKIPETLITLDAWKNIGIFLIRKHNLYPSILRVEFCHFIHLSILKSLYNIKLYHRIY